MPKSPVVRKPEPVSAAVGRLRSTGCSSAAFLAVFGCARANTPGPLNPLRLSPQHATAVVANLSREVAWYEHVLGFRKGPSFLSGPDFKLQQMTLPGYRIDLVWQRGSVRPPRRPEYFQQGWLHVDFTTPTLEADLRRLLAQHVHVTVIRNGQSAIRRLVLHDPEGNEIEILPR